MRKSLCVSKAVMCLALACLIVLSTSCRTRPAPDAGFAKNPEKMERDRNIPFQGVWCREDAKEMVKGHDQFMVAPVNTSFLTDQDWWRELNARGEDRMRRDIKELAQLTRETFVKELEGGYGDYRDWTLVNVPGPRTLILELAIVELVPNKRFWNTVMTAGGFVVPGLGMATALGGGSVAIEGRFRDGATKKIICEFKDRRTGKMSVVDVQEIRTLYGPARDAINGWARETNRLMHVPAGTRVRRTRQFRLLNW